MWRSIGRDFSAASRLTSTAIPNQGPDEDEYLFIDESACLDDRFFYWVEEIEAGVRTGVHGPVSLP